MKYKFLIIASLISFATYAQKKPVKKTRLLPPPPIVPMREAAPPSIYKNSFPETITFKWINQPEVATTFTPADVIEKSYTFSGQGRNVRINTVYPKNNYEYKKPKDGELAIAQSLTIRYKDYKNVTIDGNNIKIASDDGKEIIRLMLTKKGTELLSLKEVNGNKSFTVTEQYAGEPTIGL